MTFSLTNLQRKQEMAEMQCTHIPVRSISLPSRSHPNCLKIETELTTLKKTCQSSLGSAESIQFGLTRLADLFHSIQELTGSPNTQQAFHHNYLNQVEYVLDGSVLGLLDVCSNARDMFLAMRQHVQDLQSALRRRGKDSRIERDFLDYINFRKKTKKEIARSLKSLKKMGSSGTVTTNDFSEDNHFCFVLKVISEASGIAISIFTSLLLFLSVPVVGGWLLILSKLMRSSQEQRIFNEVSSVDIAVFSIHAKMMKNDHNNIEVQEVMRQLEILDGSINGFEAKLGCTFRSLIQNRASLLNLVTL